MLRLRLTHFLCHLPRAFLQRLHLRLFAIHVNPVHRRIVKLALNADQATAILAQHNVIDLIKSVDLCPKRHLSGSLLHSLAIGQTAAFTQAFQLSQDTGTQ
nr:hypothetical protein [Xanthomonas sp. GW]